jgi:vitamin B12/bleomycin/antimicrobial peptide transport system ATP-binding/permease protein
LVSRIRSMGRRFAAVGLPFFRSGARRIAGVGAAGLFALLLIINAANVVNSYVGRDFMSALAERRSPELYVFAATLAGVFAFLTIVEVFARYVEQWLGLKWREWLTERFFTRYLASRTYLRLVHRVDIDNPDQRISEDVRTFTAETLSFLILLVNGVLTLAAFSGVLWSISPGLFVIAFGYALFGSLGTILLGRRLIPLNNLQLRKEADLRYALGRVREHAESVAQLGREPEQKAILDERLGRVVENFRGLIVVTRNLSFFTTGYGYLPQIIPALVVAGLYLRGEVEFGTVTQAAMAFAQVQGAFSIIVTQFQQLSAFAAVVDRLGSLWEATEPTDREFAELLPRAKRATEKRPALVPGTNGAPATRVEESPECRRLAYDHLTLWMPAGHRRLVDDLTAEIQVGMRWAVTGSPVGSRALLLATAGLWRDGAGRIRRPVADDIFFLPRQVSPPVGRLRDILSVGLDGKIADDRLRGVLGEVGLEPTINRLGGIDIERRWRDCMTSHELQALAFARLLLANPRFAFLDECTCSMDKGVAERLYGALARSSITYVSACCPESLFEFHHCRLELLEGGRWRVEPGRADAATDVGHAVTGVADCAARPANAKASNADPLESLENLQERKRDHESTLPQAGRQSHPTCWPMPQRSSHVRFDRLDPPSAYARRSQTADSRAP